MKQIKKNYSNMAVDDFLEHIDESDDEATEPMDDDTTAQITKTSKGVKEKALKIKKKKQVKGDDNSEDEEKSHKQALKRLKDVDPEFYQFLEQNDKKLLKFGSTLENESSDDDKESEDEDDEKDSTNENSVHAPGNLEEASDESDFEPDDTNNRDADDSVVTIKLLKKWQDDISAEKPSLDTLRNVTAAFNSALLSISGDSSKQGKYVVEGSAVFNGILQLCILNFETALRKYLGVKDKTIKNVQKSKKFKKVKVLLKHYLLDITSLLDNVTSATILTVLLKHLHQICSVLPAFANTTKPILKRLIVLWSGSEETIRILAFLCILRITRQQQQLYINNVLKMMYLSYVKNSRFVSPNSLPGINFMRRSLAEMFALDLNISYQHAFLFIRQLAIHLRNAVTLKKKESFQAVYNWQYINALRLWVDVLSITANKPQLQPLIYPLVSIVIGVIKLIPSAAYFPLRFHCCRMLADLSRETNNFVPVLPMVLEVLNSSTFNTPHKKLSMRPLKFTCILRASKSQLLENAFRDEVIENVYGLALQILAQESSSIAFPDLVVMPLLMLKNYIKKSKNANYNKKLKALVEKIQENVSFIENERKSINFTLKDYQLINGWETTIRNKGTPLLQAFQDYHKITEKKRKREAADTDSINTFDLPGIKKPGKRTVSSEKGEVELFPDTDSDDELEVEKPLPKKPKLKKNSKKVIATPEDTTNSNEDEPEEETVDIVEDFKIEDW